MRNERIVIIIEALKLAGSIREVRKIASEAYVGKSPRGNDQSALQEAVLSAKRRISPLESKRAGIGDEVGK